jgi:RHS repeat-associated protein
MLERVVINEILSGAHAYRTIRSRKMRAGFFSKNTAKLLKGREERVRPAQAIEHAKGRSAIQLIVIASLAGPRIVSRHGGVRGLLNVNAGVAAEYRYTPYGEVELSTSSVNQPFRFMARELDSKSGLYYVRNRWYDPLMGRFISEDPIGLAGGLNTYAYANNDPINMRDPSGLNPCGIGGDGPGDLCVKYLLGELAEYLKGNTPSDDNGDPTRSKYYPGDMYQMRSCDPRSNEAHLMQIDGTWAAHYNSAPCRAGRDLMRAERARVAADQAAEAAARQAARRASREACRAQPRPAPGRLTAYFHEAKWDAGLVLAGVAAGAIFGPGILIGGAAGIVLDLGVGAIVEVEGNRIMDRCGPGVF